LIHALEFFSIQVIYDVPKWLISLIRSGEYLYTPLSPASVRKLLRSKFKDLSGHVLDIPTAVELLKYIVADKRYNALHDLPLFPCRDGQLRSLAKSTGL